MTNQWNLLALGTRLNFKNNMGLVNIMLIFKGFLGVWILCVMLYHIKRASSEVCIFHTQDRAFKLVHDHVLYAKTNLLRASACKNRESQVKWKYSNFFLFHQINPFSVPTMGKILKRCCDIFFVRFLQNPDFAGNEVIFMLEPADI
jgi:hypothetical protein